MNAGNLWQHFRHWGLWKRIKWHAGKCISRIDFTQLVLDFKTELFQLLCPSLLKSRAEVGQWIVVRNDSEVSSRQVTATFFSDHPFHGQKFQLHAAVEGAVLFTWSEVLTGIGCDTLLPILFLRQDSAEPVMTCICLQDEGFGVVSRAKHRDSC